MSSKIITGLFILIAFSSAASVHKIPSESSSFAKTLIFGLTTKNLKACYPENWFKFNETHNKNSTIPLSLFNNSLSELSAILDYMVDSANDDVCIIKNDILKFFAKK